MTGARLPHAIAALGVALLAVSALSPAPPPTAPIAHASVAAGAAATAAASFELVSQSDASKPVRWLACKPIEFRVNTDDMPAGMIATVKRSMAIVTEQTGVRFRYAGHTRHTFSDRSHADVPTIYFSFTAKRKAQGQTFGDASGGEIGVGGPAAAWYRDRNGRMVEAMTYGRVLLSSRFDAPRSGAGVTWESLILHEVGHALNLAHREAATSVMHPVLTDAAPARYTLSEVRALRRVLQTSGCDYTAWSRL